MLNLNSIQHGTCYETKEWRNWILFHTTSSSHFIFNSADRIKLADEILKRHREGESDLYTKLNVEPDLLGIIKIMTAIENYFKAEILDQEFIIHKINDREKTLKKRQKSEPIHLSEIADFKKQKIKDEGTFILALDNITINFSDIINSESYLKLLSTKTEIIDIIKDLAKERNTLHYMTTLSSVFSDHVNYRYKTLKDNINSELLDLNERIGRQMKISEKAYLKNR